MNQSKNHLDLIDLEKRYGETLAVRGINLSLPENTYCCLLGPSGCGKTSLLRMIAGHEDITKRHCFSGQPGTYQMNHQLRAAHQ